MLLRDEITSGARTVLLVLLAAAGLVFIIACCNVANLILARTVRREGELSVRVALGASRGALRRMLLAESLLLCGTGAAVGVVSAAPMVAILARYASRFSVRALDLTVDNSLLWVGAALAIVAAVILAFVPRLPSSDVSNGLSLSNGSVRVTGSTSRRQRIFAVTQIAASFVLLASRPAHVPQSGCHQSACLLDGSGVAILSWNRSRKVAAYRAAPHHWSHHRY
jgi:cell division protein FtsX